MRTFRRRFRTAGALVDGRAGAGAFELLADSLRRRLLGLLVGDAGEAAPPVPVHVETLAACLHAGSVDGSHGRPLWSVALTFHHTHLPKLDRAGVLTYDATARLVVDVDVDRVATLVETVELALSETRPA